MIQLVEGARGVLRNGERTDLLIHDPISSPRYPWRAVTISKDGTKSYVVKTWKDNGSFWDDGESEFDIIRVIPPKDNTVPAIDQVSPEHLKRGVENIWKSFSAGYM